MKKIKLEDVASYANVSPTTVSRVINNRGSISDKTRKKVTQAMEDLGYYPNEIARSLYGKKTNSIGILFPDLMNPFFGEMTTKLEHLLSEKDYKVLICNTQNNLEKETNYLKMLLANQVDGIIVGSHNKPSEIYQQAHLPIVSIDRYVSNKVPIVRSDNYNGARTATNYLLEKGCEKIALISGSSLIEIQQGDQRVQGYLDIMKENNLCPISYHVEFDKPIEYQKKKIDEFLKKYQEVDGIFATGDSIASLLFHAAKKMKRDIEIVGYDGTEFITNYFNNFATIKQPIDRMAEKSIQLLLEFIDGDYSHSGKEFLFDTELIEP